MPLKLYLKLHDFNHAGTLIMLKKPIYCMIKRNKHPTPSKVQDAYFFFTKLIY